MDLKNLSNKEFIDLARGMWRFENARCFNGGLLRVPFLGTNDTAFGGGWMGVHYPNEISKRDTILLSRTYLKSDRLLRQVLIHEMIHQQQGQESRKRHHDRFFRNRCITILAITGIWVN